VTLTREEVLDAIRTERLHGYRWFEDATNKTDVVAIQRTNAGWVVFATDERATPLGLTQFDAEGPALDDFLERLRASKRVAEWEAAFRRKKEARIDGQADHDLV